MCLSSITIKLMSHFEVLQYVNIHTCVDAYVRTYILCMCVIVYNLLFILNHKTYIIMYVFPYF